MALVKWTYIGEISDTYVNIVFKLNTAPINLFIANSTTILHTQTINTLDVTNIKINGLTANTQYRFYFATTPTIDILTAIPNASITTLTPTIDPIIAIIGNNYAPQSNLIDTINSGSANIVIHNGGNIFASELFWKTYNAYSVMDKDCICDVIIKTKLTQCLEECYDYMLSDPQNIPHLTTKSNLFLFGKHDYVRFFDEIKCPNNNQFEHIKTCMIEVYKKYLLKCPTTSNYQCYTYTNSIYVLLNGFTNLTDGYIMEQDVYDTLKLKILNTANATKKIYLIIPGLPFQIDKYYNISSCELCKFMNFIKCINTRLADTKLIGSLEVYMNGNITYGPYILNFCTTGSVGIYPIYHELGGINSINKFIGICSSQDITITGTLINEEYYSILITNNILTNNTLPYTFAVDDPYISYMYKLTGRNVGDIYESCKNPDTYYAAIYQYNQKVTI